MIHDSDRALYSIKLLQTIKVLGYGMKRMSFSYLWVFFMFVAALLLLLLWVSSTPKPTPAPSAHAPTLPLSNFPR